MRDIFFNEETSPPNGMETSTSNSSSIPTKLTSTTQDRKFLTMEPTIHYLVPFHKKLCMMENIKLKWKINIINLMKNGIVL